MSASNHLCHLDIQSLLSDIAAADALESAAEHLEQCDRCQTELETAAARPEIWEKATQWFSDSNTTVLSRAGLPPMDSIEVTGPSMSDMLDTPTHPEFLGRVPGYDIEREIGRGGMGVVFKAFDTELHRVVAIKFLSPQMAMNGTARQRFAREARAAAAVFHPNVLPIHGVSSHRDIPYLVMPYVSGPSLQQLIDQHGPLDEKELVRIAMQIAAGLSAAHLQGLVHRDIKPANILVEADVSRVSVTDFGLARAIDDASMTQSGSFLGTPNYMSPEQATGKRVDTRSDLFSLGSVMYFAASGRLPFRAESPVCVLNRIAHDEPTSMRELDSELSATTIDIIEKLLEKQVDERFGSASELHETLQQHLAHLHRPGVIKPPRVRAVGGSSRRRTMVIRSAMIGVLLGVGVAAFVWRNPGGKKSGGALQVPNEIQASSATKVPGKLPDAEAAASEAEATARGDLKRAANRAEQIEDARRSGRALPGVRSPDPPMPPTAPVPTEQNQTSTRAFDAWSQYWFGWLGL